MLCYAMPCYAMLQALLADSVLCYAVLCYAADLFCCAMLCCSLVTFAGMCTDKSTEERNCGQQRQEKLLQACMLPNQEMA